jgi:hypothetical protein
MFGSSAICAKPAGRPTTLRGPISICHRWGRYMLLARLGLVLAGRLLPTCCRNSSRLHCRNDHPVGILAACARSACNGTCRRCVSGYHRVIETQEPSRVEIRVFPAE